MLFIQRRIPSETKLRKKAQSLRREYRGASPFPHVVIDGFFDSACLHKVAREFPAPDKVKWRHYHKPTEEKFACEKTEYFGKNTASLLQELNGPKFIRFLENLSGIQGLAADPSFRGGGMHQIVSGGYLKIHADFNWHEKMAMYRRINLLLYLNENWHEEFGGHLEIWDKEMRQCAKRILPVFNRCVIFNTDDTSFHGHPEPLTCPSDITRKSLALYYYTAEKPPGSQDSPHSTLFQKRPSYMA